jgi:hypothetical protein
MSAVEPGRIWLGFAHVCSAEILSVVPFVMSKKCLKIGSNGQFGRA